MDDRDKQLAARAGSGDTTALEAIYGRYGRRVWRYAWLRTRSREAAADIVQETFLQVARVGGQFEGRSSLGTWLYAVARSVAVRHAIGEQRQRQATDPAIIKISAGQDEDSDGLARSEIKQAVRKAVSQLIGPQRDAIVLYEVSGLSVKETAGVLGWSESRVKTTLFRARRKLRELLAPHVADAEHEVEGGGKA